MDPCRRMVPLSHDTVTWWHLLPARAMVRSGDCHQFSRPSDRTLRHLGASHVRNRCHDHGTLATARGSSPTQPRRIPERPKQMPRKATPPFVSHDAPASFLSPPPAPLPLHSPNPQTSFPFAMAGRSPQVPNLVHARFLFRPAAMGATATLARPCCLHHIYLFQKRIRALP